MAYSREDDRIGPAQSRSQIAIRHRARSLKVAPGSSGSEQVLDQLPSSGTIDYLRSAMVTLGALPEREDRLEAGAIPAVVIDDAYCP